MKKLKAKKCLLHQLIGLMYYFQFSDYECCVKQLFFFLVFVSKNNPFLCYKIQSGLFLPKLIFLISYFHGMLNLFELFYVKVNLRMMLPSYIWIYYYRSAIWNR